MVFITNATKTIKSDAYKNLFTPFPKLDNKRVQPTATRIVKPKLNLNQRDIRK